MMDFIRELTGWQIFIYSYSAAMIIFNLLFTVVVAIGGSFDLVYFFKELNKEPDEIHTK